MNIYLSLSFVINDQGHKSINKMVWMTDDGSRYICIADQSSERRMLITFFDTLLMLESDDIIIVGHSIKQQLNLIWQRSIVRDVTPSALLKTRDDVKYICTKTMWGDDVSLRELCDILSIDFDGEDLSRASVIKQIYYKLKRSKP